MKHNLLIVLFFLVAGIGIFYRFADAGKRRIRITNDLDDVIDDEEDETWKEWGKKKSPDADLPDLDFSDQTDFTKLQSEMMKYQTGPAYGFVKLRLGQRKRTPDMVSEIAMKWTKVAKTGSIDAKFMGVDLSTIMFTLEKGQDALELKEFVLSQDDAYEVKIGDQLFQRPGDPPFDDVFQKHHGNKDKVDYTGSAKDDKQQKDEL